MWPSLQRACLIVGCSAALGLGFNLVSPKGIPFITPPKPELKPEDLIALEAAKELWSSGVGFFLDARAPDDFAAGHVANALNLPADHFEQHYGEVAPLLGPDTPLVLYCDGVECELSHRLKDKLLQMGHTNAKILQNGWTVWRNAGLATETGARK
jgi:rhodanese-related sulfurtransferase